MSCRTFNPLQSSLLQCSLLQCSLLQCSKVRRRGLLRASVVACMGSLAVLSGVAPGLAQPSGYPTKPVRLVINFPPGSSPDVVGRAVAQPLSTALGQPIVIENRAGAGGTIGVDAVAKSPADGYTLLMTAGSTMSIVPHVLPSLPYNPTRDLVPVAAAARIENFLIIRADLPAKTYAQFVEHLKRNPAKLSYGSAGNGTSPHIAAELWKEAAGVRALHVPYRGTAPAIQDLLGGQIDFMFDSGSAFPHVQSGKFLMLGVATSKRLAMFPDVPTFAELGLQLETGTTHSFYAPAGTPAAIVEQLNHEINKALATPAARQPIENLGAQATPMSSDALRALMEADSKRYGEIVRKANIKAE